MPLRLVLRFLCALAVMMPASAGPALAADITTRTLPHIGSEAWVTGCGDRVLILSNQRAVSAFGVTGNSIRVDGAGAPLALFSHDSRCFEIDPMRGIVDLSGPAPTLARAISGTLPDTITAAAQSSGGNVWIGVEGSDQVGRIDAGGAVRYFDLPEGDANHGILHEAAFRLPPALSATLMFTSYVQALAASPRYVWLARVASPPTTPSYVARIDTTTNVFERVPLETYTGVAGLAVVADDRALALRLDDHLLLLGPDRIQSRWELPGKRIYVAPPNHRSLITAVPGGADLVSLKDGVIWHFRSSQISLTREDRFPGRPSWLVSLGASLVGINTDASEMMTTQL